jgi:hypothetical protein
MTADKVSYVRSHAGPRSGASRQRPSDNTGYVRRSLLCWLHIHAWTLRHSIANVQVCVRGCGAVRVIGRVA